MLDVHVQFRDAIQSTGLEPPPIIEPGRLYRFPGVDKRPGNTAGWCYLFPDGLGGSFGDWASDITINWRAQRKRPFTPTERIEFIRQKAEAQRQREQARLLLQAKTTKRARKI